MEPLLTDSFGREHTYLRISLTEKCNLRCTYCMPEEGVLLSPREHLLMAEEVVSFARTFISLGVKKIRLTGGEPLLRKDCPNIIERISELPVELSITTNAVLVDRYLDILKASSIQTINVSLDSLRENRFGEITKRKDFHRIIKNIQLLIDHNFRLKINAVIMKGVNDDEIIDFIEWTKNTPIEVRFIEFMPFNGNQWEWDKIYPYHEFLQLVQRHFQIDEILMEKSATSKMYRVKDYKGTFGMISSMTNHFCGSCNRIRLTANGRIKNCLFSNNELDLLTPYRNGEDIKPLIRQAIMNKKAKHGGIKDLEHLDDDKSEMSERSMILIGG